MTKRFSRTLILCAVIAGLLFSAGCAVVNTRVMDIPGSPCKRVVLVIEEEVSPGHVVRREEAVIICPGDEGWEKIAGNSVSAAVSAVKAAVSLLGY